MADARIILTVTGSRAEYGLLRPVIEAVEAHAQLRGRVVVAGSHLVAGTDKDVRADGVRVAATVRMQKPGESGRAGDVQAIARGMAGFGQVFEKVQPDFVLVLGDRVEAFAAASAAAIGGYRVAHLHGGDRAEGVADESMRHAITKLAHLHLAATSESKKRILRMGEATTAVHRVGSPAIDGLSEVEAAIDGPACLVMHHPIGASDAEEQKMMAAVLAAAGPMEPMVFSPNLDPGRLGILDAIDGAGLKPVSHVPRERFLSLLKGAKMIVGNSSAGLIEAAALGVPCVNVGPRQAGRERPGNVIDARPTKTAIKAALRQAKVLDRKRMYHPYGNGKTGPRVAELLAKVKLDELPVRKQNRY